MSGFGLVFLVCSIAARRVAGPALSATILLTSDWTRMLLRWLLRRTLAHRLAKPCVPCVRSEPRVPNHQEMKRTQLARRFHEPQGGIPFHHVPHAIGQCED